MVVWRRWIFPILMVMIFGLIAASLVKVAFFPDEAQAAAEVPTAQITDPVIPVSRGSITNQLDVAATVARDEPVPLKGDIDGTVVESFVVDGAHVKVGQVLFRVKQTYPERIFEFKAPIAGVINELALVKNQPTSIGAEYAKITPETFHLLGTIEPVELYRLINAPTDASVMITGGPAPFTCSGLSVQVAEDASTSVRCAVPADQVVFAGLPAVVGITVGTVENALVVPTTAVKGGAGTGVVWVDVDGESEERPVTLGISDGVSVEVLEGLAEGDMIREFVPGVEVAPQEECYSDGQGGEICDSVVQW